jgi:toxin ParE1/3/4
MMVRYTPRARRHLEDIGEFLTARNPEAARRIGERLREMIDLLAAFPEMGHVGTMADTREMAVRGTPYLVVYRIERSPEDRIVILGIYHGAQLRPGQERPTRR